MNTYRIVDNNILIEDFLDFPDQENLFQFITTETNIINAGRAGRKMVRMTSKGLKYKIQGKPYQRKDFTSTVLKIKKQVDCLLKQKDYFNTCALNYYPSGRSGFRNHTDWMKELEQPMIVATYTLGHSNRTMNLVHRKTGETYPIVLKNNSLILMGPHMQRHWLHGIPKAETTQPRLSLSFRKQKYNC